MNHVTHAKPQNPNHVPRANYVQTPVGRDQENARRAAKRNIDEDIKAAQRDVDGYERRIIPLRLALKNAKGRSSRLQKKLTVSESKG